MSRTDKTEGSNLSFVETAHTWDKIFMSVVCLGYGYMLPKFCFETSSGWGVSAQNVLRNGQTRCQPRL